MSFYKKILFQTVGFISLCTIVFAQDSQLPPIPKTGKMYNDFVPKGWNVLERLDADFNNDNLTDEIIVLNSSSEEENPDESRLLLILKKLPNKTYELCGFSANVILCKGCGGVYGDPFQDITIKKNIITISHYGGSSWRWLYVHKFRYQNNGWFLIGQTLLSYHNTSYCDSIDEFGNLEETDENLVTGDVITKIVDENCNKKVEKKKVKPKPLIKLEDFQL